MHSYPAARNLFRQSVLQLWIHSSIKIWLFQQPVNFYKLRIAECPFMFLPTRQSGNLRSGDEGETFNLFNNLHPSQPPSVISLPSCDSNNLTLEIENFNFHLLITFLPPEKSARVMAVSFCCAFLFPVFNCAKVLWTMFYLGEYQCQVNTNPLSQLVATLSVISNWFPSFNINSFPEYQL